MDHGHKTIQILRKTIRKIFGLDKDFIELSSSMFNIFKVFRIP